MWSRRCKVSQRHKTGLKLCLESTNCLLDLVYFKWKKYDQIKLRIAMLKWCMFVVLVLHKIDNRNLIEIPSGNFKVLDTRMLDCLKFSSI